MLLPCCCQPTAIPLRSPSCLRHANSIPLPLHGKGKGKAWQPMPIPLPRTCRYHPTGMAVGRCESHGDRMAIGLRRDGNRSATGGQRDAVGMMGVGWQCNGNGTAMGWPTPNTPMPSQCHNGVMAECGVVPIPRRGGVVLRVPELFACAARGPIGFRPGDAAGPKAEGSDASTRRNYRRSAAIAKEVGIELRPTVSALRPRALPSPWHRGPGGHPEREAA